MKTFLVVALLLVALLAVVALTGGTGAHGPGRHSPTSGPVPRGWTQPHAGVSL